LIVVSAWADLAVGASVKSSVGIVAAANCADPAVECNDGLDHVVGQQILSRV